MKNILFILFFLILHVLVQGVLAQEINKNIQNNPQLVDYLDNSISHLWIKKKNGVYPESVCTVFNYLNGKEQEWVSAAHCVLENTNTKLDESIIELYVGLNSEKLTKVSIKDFSYNRVLSHDYVRLVEEENNKTLAIEKCEIKPVPGETVWVLGSPNMIMPIAIPGYYSGELNPGNSILLNLYLKKQEQFYYLITQRLYPGASGSPALKFENGKYCVFGIMSFYYKEQVFQFYLGSVVSRLF